MFTDIVGYSAITQRNESLALALLDEHNRILRAVIEQHRGVVIKTVGDAFLAEFPSALYAVNAAIQVQERLHLRNAEQSGEAIRVRIGIHLGDVVFRDNDVFGDGVNIAARIQSIAEPGGISLSGDVAVQVENKLDRPLVAMGTPRLKNIERAIPVFAVRMPGTVAAQIPGGERHDGQGFLRNLTARPLRLIGVLGLVCMVAGGSWWLSQRGANAGRTSVAGAPQASLAVLPFADLSQTRDQEYLGDGLAEEILNQLAQVQSLRLVGRTSSFSFKGKNEDLRLIGQKLGVANLLEGSVRKDGNQLRVTAQLIRADDGTHLWSKTYARELKDVFAVQDEIARDVATALAIKLETGVLTRAAGGTNNVEAYEKLLQAREIYGRGGIDNSLRTAQLLREAVAIDPNFGAAWVALVWVLYQVSESSYEANASASREIAEIVERSMKAAPDAPWTQQLQGQNHLSHYRWAEGIAALKAVQATQYGARRTVDAFANPPIYLRWSSLHSTGHLTDAARMGDEWANVEPLSAQASITKVLWLMYVGRDREAVAEYERSKSLSYPAEWPMLTRLLRTANPDPAALKAQFIAAGVDKARPGSFPRQVFDNLGNPAALREVFQRALNAPANDWIDYSAVAVYADGFGERDLALAAVRKDALTPNVRSPHRLGTVLWYPYKTGLRSDPRFKEIIREVGLADYWRKSGDWGDYCKPVGSDDFECR